VLSVSRDSFRTVRWLVAVVVGTIDVAHFFDELQIWELGVERPGGPLGCGVGSAGRLLRDGILKAHLS